MLKEASKEIAVCGRRWDSTRPNFWGAPEGLSLESIVTGSIERAYREHQYSRSQYRSLLRYARARVNGVEVERRAWKTTFPPAGARVEILHGVRGGGGGGGGGKNPIATVLKVIVVAVAAVATWYIGGQGGVWAASTMFAAQMAVSVAAGAALMAIDALFPAPTPSLGGGYGGYDRDIEKTSQTYSISGGRNTANVGGYVPLVCGRHRFTPPLGGAQLDEVGGRKAILPHAGGLGTSRHQRQ